MKPKHKPFTRLHRLAEAAAFLGLLGTFGGYLGRYVWFLEVFSHYRIQLALCFLLYALVEVAASRRRHAAASIALAALNAVPALLLFLPDTARATAVPAAPLAHLRILQSNILTCNTNVPALFELIAKESPDVVVLQEPDDWWLRRLAPLTNSFPVFATLARDDNFGAAIFCKTNARSAEVFQLRGPQSEPCARATIAVQGKAVTIVGTHTLAPYDDTMWRGRNSFTLLLAEALREIKGPLVVTGDFNNTPWSSHLQAFLKASGLRDSSQSRGPLPTWPASAFSLARIPLDHCFHSPDVSIIDRRPGPDIGSDHLPLIIDIAF